MEILTQNILVLIKKKKNATIDLINALLASCFIIHCLNLSDILSGLRSTVSCYYCLVSPGYQPAVTLRIAEQAAIVRPKSKRSGISFARCR